MTIQTDQGRVRYLVSWIENEGLVRGQTVKTHDEANRLFDHLLTTPALYIEIRRIGNPPVRKYSKKVH